MSVTHFSMTLFHGPDRDENLSTYPHDSCEFLDGSHPPVGGGKVVDDGDRQHRIESLVSEGKVQIVTGQNLVAAPGTGRSRQGSTVVYADLHHVSVDVQVFAVAASWRGRKLISQNIVFYYAIG